VKLVEEKDYCSDCGTEFIGFHFCELIQEEGENENAEH
jgi:hypothetical protein